MKQKTLVFWLLLTAAPLLALAQDFSATASIDSTRILIGDQLNVKLKITAPATAKIIIPQFNEKSLDTLGIDWVASSAIDTLNESGKRTYNQTITITAFDSGNYVFPAIAVLAADSQIIAATQPLYFEVLTVQVDTTAAFRDIKQPAKEMITFKEVLPYLLLGLAVAAAILLAVYLVRKFYRKKTPKKVLPKPKPKVKPHVAALAALEELRLKHLRQDGQVKLYYSELTDIVREYIDGRWDIDAPEMTSSEILEAVAALNLDSGTAEELRVILSTADLVKFAKWRPLPNEHDTCFKDAVKFVETTKEQTDTQTNTNNAKKS